MHWSGLVYIMVPSLIVIALAGIIARRLLRTPYSHGEPTLGLFALALITSLILILWLSGSVSSLIQLLVMLVATLMILVALGSAVFALGSAVWHLLFGRWRASATALGISILLGLSAGSVPQAVSWTDAQLKRPLREHVIAHLEDPERRAAQTTARDPSILKLPRQSAWLSTDGEIFWFEKSDGFEVLFFDWRGILDGHGAAYSSNGRFPAVHLLPEDSTFLGGRWWMGPS